MKPHPIRIRHCRQQLRQIRTDQWIAGIRRILWWSGFLMQIGCMIVARQTDAEPTMPSTTPWQTIGIVILIGWALWILCPILQLMEIAVTPPPHHDNRDQATIIICAITTTLVMFASAYLFFIATLTPSPA